ncbi:MAG: C-terminal helicase domain-containing protein, partial [Planctomycetota bacterium]
MSFKSSIDVKALLLNVKIAGNGLTIVEASHVFIVHPLLSTAIEDQAIGRIHRLGQTKPCAVT